MLAGVARRTLDALGGPLLGLVVTPLAHHALLLAGGVLVPSRTTHMHSRTDSAPLASRMFSDIGGIVSANPSPTLAR